jgi:hypothetical protein
MFPIFVLPVAAFGESRIDLSQLLNAKPSSTSDTESYKSGKIFQLKNFSKNDRDRIISLLPALAAEKINSDSAVRIRSIRDLTPTTKIVLFEVNGTPCLSPINIDAPTLHDWIDPTIDPFVSKLDMGKVDFSGDEIPPSIKSKMQSHLGDASKKNIFDIQVTDWNSRDRSLSYQVNGNPFVRHLTLAKEALIKGSLIKDQKDNKINELTAPSRSSEPSDMASFILNLDAGKVNFNTDETPLVIKSRIQAQIGEAYISKEQIYHIHVMRWKHGSLFYQLNGKAFVRRMELEKEASIKNSLTRAQQDTKIIEHSTPVEIDMSNIHLDERDQVTNFSEAADFVMRAFLDEKNSADALIPYHLVRVKTKEVNDAAFWARLQELGVSVPDFSNREDRFSWLRAILFHDIDPNVFFLNNELSKSLISTMIEKFDVLMDEMGAAENGQAQFDPVEIRAVKRIRDSLEKKKSDKAAKNKQLVMDSLKEFIEFKNYAGDRLARSLGISNPFLVDSHLAVLLSSYKPKNFRYPEYPLLLAETGDAISLIPVLREELIRSTDIRMGELVRRAMVERKPLSLRIEPADGKHWRAIRITIHSRSEPNLKSFSEIVNIPPEFEGERDRFITSEIYLSLVKKTLGIPSEFDWQKAEMLLHVSKHDDTPKFVPSVLEVLSTLRGETAKDLSDQSHPLIDALESRIPIQLTVKADDKFSLKPKRDGWFKPKIPGLRNVNFQFVFVHPESGKQVQSYSIPIEARKLNTEEILRSTEWKDALLRKMQAEARKICTASIAQIPADRLEMPKRIPDQVTMSH